MNIPEVNHEDDKVKNDEELERLKQLEIELIQKKLREKRRRLQNTLKALWPEWNVERMMDKAIKILRIIHL